MRNQNHNIQDQISSGLLYLPSNEKKKYILEMAIPLPINHLLGRNDGNQFQNQ